MVNDKEMYDIAILGGGPSGMTAGIYSARYSRKTIIIGEEVGGTCMKGGTYENWPGEKKISGFELVNKIKEHVESYGVKILPKKVTSIEKQGRVLIVKMGEEKIQAKTIIIALGTKHRKLEIPGEEKLLGKGVSYCATCDGPLYRGKTTVVVGGGNSALDAAEYLSKVAKKVYLIHRRDEFRGEKILIDQVKAAENIEIIYNANTTEIKGADRVEALVYKTNDGKESEISVEGIFIEVGHIAKTAWLESLVKLNERREILISPDCETNQPGVFAAGDVTQITYKQAVISAGEGAKAGLQAYKYLQGDKPMTPDWTPKK